jgi:hypothetical protein
MKRLIADGATPRARPRRQYAGRPPSRSCACGGHIPDVRAEETPRLAAASLDQRGCRGMGRYDRQPHARGRAGWKRWPGADFLFRARWVPRYSLNSQPVYQTANEHPANSRPSDPSGARLPHNSDWRILVFPSEGTSPDGAIGIALNLEWLKDLLKVRQLPEGPWPACSIARVT